MTSALATGYSGKRVFLTGHTGFKGAWLGYWLTRLGAEVTGYSLEPHTDPSLFEALGLEKQLKSVTADVRDGRRLKAELLAAKPDVVFHLAAQAIVRNSYADPCGTYETNTMGTVNLLEAARASETAKAVVVITSDKCYQNLDSGRPFRECDPMGGLDPYSCSKGCAELVTEAYRHSFFSPEGGSEGHAQSSGLASARAGNVIGGGDWAVDRIIPDCVRALSMGRPVVVRNPKAVRPWQHVLEPLSGYLWLAHRLLDDPRAFEGAWNLGPEIEDGSREVRWVVESFIKEWGTGEWTTPPTKKADLHEATLLNLDSTKAHDGLGWRPVWGAAKAVQQTAAWYRDYYRAIEQGPAAAAEQTVRELTSGQLETYEADARAAGLAWANAGAGRTKKGR